MRLSDTFPLLKDSRIHLGNTIDIYHMTARFPAMIGIMRNCIRAGVHSCSVPANSLCFRVLTLLRENGLISGFSHCYTRRRLRQNFYHGYPRVTITFKFFEHGASLLKDIRPYKNTRSNHYHVRRRIRSSANLSASLQYILSNSSGLVITSLESFTPNQFPRHGKILAEIRV
jgi:ribosomal protein S8